MNNNADDNKKIKAKTQPSLMQRIEEQRLEQQGLSQQPLDQQGLGLQRSDIPRQSRKSTVTQLFAVCGLIFWMASQTLGTGRLAFIPTWVVVCLASPFFFGAIFMLLPESQPPLPASKKLVLLLMAITTISPILWFAIYTDLPLILRIIMVLPILAILPLAIWSYSFRRREKEAAAKKAIQPDARFIPKDKKW